jgi:hypothetical protein
VPYSQLLYGIFKGLSWDGGLADFLKNHHASLFNEGLLNEPNFGWITDGLDPSLWTVPLTLVLLQCK